MAAVFPTKALLSAGGLEKHGHVELVRCLLQQKFKALGMLHAFVYFHPQSGIIPLSQQPSLHPAAASQPGLHGTNKRFGLMRIVLTYPVIDVIVIQGRV